MRKSIHARARCFRPSGAERRGVALHLGVSHGSTNAAVRGLRAHDRRDRQLEPLLRRGQAGSVVADCRAPRRGPEASRIRPSIDAVAAQIPPTMRVFERGWLSSNNVLLYDDEHTATLVDTGYVSHRAQTLALVQSALGGRKLARIFNTHLHSDHCGGNAHLQRATGARIAIPPGHSDAVARWDEDAADLPRDRTGVRALRPRRCAAAGRHRADGRRVTGR